MIWLFFVWIIIQIGVVFSADTGDIIITEFYYNKSAGNLPEYVELFNNTESPIELHEWKVEINGTLFEIDGACDDSVVAYVEQYTDELACTVAGHVWKPFSINSNDYAVISSRSGLLRSEDENGLITDYCSSIHYPNPFYPCDTSIDSLFWSLNTFLDLPNTSDTIKIFDNSSSLDPIDIVPYNMGVDFLEGGAVSGRAAVFIIDPTSVGNASDKNDHGENWRSSKHPSKYLYTNSGNDFGSPMSSNFITPTIWIDAKANSNTDSCSYSYTDSLMICYPHSDGKPGGDASIELRGTAEDYSGSPVLLDTLFWTINGETASSLGGLSWSPNNPLPYDTNFTPYEIPLFTWDSSGFMGKTDTTIYIKEINEKPSIVALNGQSSQAEIHVFENTSNSLYAEVTDPELCSSINTPCNFDSLTFISSSFDNSLPFIWTSAYSLSSPDSLTAYFTAPQIDSLNGISANDNPDTLEFQFKVTDPFGAVDSNLVTVIVHNINESPELELITFIPADTTILEDTPLVIELEASDSDGDELTYFATTDAEASIIIDGSSITILPALNFNGDMLVTVSVTDGSKIDSQTFSITTKSVNDTPSPFSIYPKLYEYNYSGMDTTAFYVENDSLYYFHLSQEMGLSLNSISLLRFAWEKNNELDADTNTDLNLGESFHLYYRLEAVLNNMFFIILRDSIDHDDDLFADSDSIFADINMTDEFIYYVNSYEERLENTKTTLDTTGYTSYQWRVVAQNYQKDNLGHDPFQISSGFDSTDFRIDLIPPVASEFNIMYNKIYPNYYDVLWRSNGLYLTDSTFININEASNQFAAVSFRNPRQLTDSLYHFTGTLPASLTSATINYRIQLRDRAMNSGERRDTVSYAYLDPGVSSSFSSPSGLARFNIDKYRIDEPTAVFITEEKINSITKRETSDIFQLTPSVHFSSGSILLNNKGEISFDINEYLNPDIYDWQYIIIEMNDNGYEQLTTYFSNGEVSAHIYTLSSFAVYVNLGIARPIPTTFKLQKNYPNPFNPTTIIPLEIPGKSFVKASIYNILGQEVVTLLEGIQSSGYYDLQWNGNNRFGQQVSSGIYFIRVRYDEKVFTNKMMLLK